MSNKWKLTFALLLFCAYEVIALLIGSGHSTIGRLMPVVLLTIMPVGCIIGLNLQALQNKPIDLYNQQWLLFGAICIVPIAAGCTWWIVGWTLGLSIFSFIGIMSHCIWVILKTPPQTDSFFNASTRQPSKASSNTGLRRLLNRKTIASSEEESTLKVEDASIAHYRSLDPQEYKYAEKITIFQSDLFNDAYSNTIEVVLIKKSDHRLSRLYLNFEGIHGLHFNGSVTTQPFPLFEIDSIRDRQWFRTNYQVTETEHDLLSFYCESFTVHSDDENSAE